VRNTRLMVKQPVPEVWHIKYQGAKITCVNYRTTLRHLFQSPLTSMQGTDFDSANMCGSLKLIYLPSS